VGRDFKACCPFHKEKTPSFIIHPDEKYYHCFGCNKSGTVINFLMEYDRMSFVEACEHLAKQVNMSLPDDESPHEKAQRIQRERGIESMHAAAKFYFSNLSSPNSIKALEYLKKRNISTETIIAFGIGYSCDYDSLVKHLLSLGFDYKTMKYCGLVYEKNGHYSDFFALRLIIPIINAKGEVIAFGGRIIDTSSGAKYKNSLETALFLKRTTLFGVNLVKRNQHAEKPSYLILVEGYMDAISLYQAGIHNVIASMGTALHLDQCKEIKRYCDNIYVCFDGDAAGQNATWKSLQRLNDAGLNVKVVSLTDGMDPDDAVNKLGRDGFLKIVDTALPMIDYMLKTTSLKYDLNTSHGNNEFAKAAVSILSEFDIVTRDAYLNQVSELSSIGVDTLRAFSLGKIKNNITASSKSVADDVITKAENSTEVKESDWRASVLAERYILSYYFDNKKITDLSILDEECFKYPPYKKIFQSIMSTERNILVGDLYDIVPESRDEIIKIASYVSQTPVANRDTFYTQCCNHLLQHYKAKRVLQISELIKLSSNIEEINKLKNELRTLTVLKNKRTNSEEEDHV
jgi:DNA primase